MPTNTRRGVLLGIVAGLFVPRVAHAEDAVHLQWRDLLPAGQRAIPPSVQGLFDHDESALPNAAQPPSSGVRSDWNGQMVALPGFVVPLEYSGSGVTAFILVPFVGACVHVPPPPANQLVFVTTSTPYESAGLFEPVTVTGRFGTASTTTHLADIAYVMNGAGISAYRT